MPFFKLAKKINKDCVSLQVQKSILYVLKKLNKRKRACLFTSKGSVTIEAAVVSTILIFVNVFIMSFMMDLNIQISNQTKLNNMAIAYAKACFYKEKIKEASGYKEQLESINESISKGWNGVKNTSSFLSTITGVDISESRFENGIADIVLKYRIKTPYVHKSMSIKQRARVKDWTGCDLSQTYNVVYITETGSVYHLSKECSHLVVHISKDIYGNLSQLRNSGGGKYERCLNCVSEKLVSSSPIFITKEGNKYHSTLKCSGLKRTIIETDLEEVKEMKACSGCAG